MRHPLSIDAVTPVSANEPGAVIAVCAAAGRPITTGQPA
jgi:hypothetical protein